MIRSALSRFVTGHLLLPALLLAGSSATLHAMEQPVTPIPNVVIEDDIVYLGDLFDGLGEKANTPISRAPAPGQPVILNAQWLSQLARSYGLNWRPANHLVRIELQRAAEILTTEDFLTALRPEMEAELKAADYDIRLDSPNLTLNLASEDDNALILTNLRRDARNGRFTAQFEALSNGQLVKKITLSGRVIEMTEIPVLTMPMNRDGVIAAQHVEMQRVAVNSISPSRATSLDQVLGMSPRRSLRAGQPLRLADLGQPVLAERNALVTIIFQNHLMRLTSQGRALEDGGEGDVIRVKNTKSNRTIYARITAPGVVTVEPALKETVIAQR